MIEDEFQANFNGRLEVDKVIKQVEQTQDLENWYMNSLDEDVQKLVRKHYQFRGSKDIEQSVIEIFRDLFPIDQESIELTRQRVLGIQREAEHYVQNKGKFGFGAGDAKLGLVGHSMFFKLMNTDKRYWEDVYDLENQKMPTSEYAKMMKNCEFAPLRHQE